LIKTRLTLSPHHKLTTSRHNREVLPTVPISTANSVSAVPGMPFRMPTAPLGMTVKFYYIHSFIVDWPTALSARVEHSWERIGSDRGL